MVNQCLGEIQAESSRSAVAGGRLVRGVGRGRQRLHGEKVPRRHQHLDGFLQN